MLLLNMLDIIRATVPLRSLVIACGSRYFVCFLFYAVLCVLQYTGTVSAARDDKSSNCLLFLKTLHIQCKLLKINAAMHFKAYLQHFLCLACLLRRSHSSVFFKYMLFKGKGTWTKSEWRDSYQKLKMMPLNFTRTFSGQTF